MRPFGHWWRKPRRRSGGLSTRSRSGRRRVLGSY